MATLATARPHATRDTRPDPASPGMRGPTSGDSGYGAHACNGRPSRVSESGPIAFYVAHGLMCEVLDVRFPHLRINELPRASASGSPSHSLACPTSASGTRPCAANRLLTANRARTCYSASRETGSHPLPATDPDCGENVSMSPMADLASLRVRENATTPPWRSSTTWGAQLKEWVGQQP